MSVELVKHYLRAQNLEQVGRMDEALTLYERVVDAGFDSSGPYDRLIAVYSNRAQHHDVVRVVDAALAHVRTYEDKRAWYEGVRAQAVKASTGVPKAAPRGDE